METGWKVIDRNLQKPYPEIHRHLLVAEEIQKLKQTEASPVSGLGLLMVSTPG